MVRRKPAEPHLEDGGIYRKCWWAGGLKAVDGLGGPSGATPHGRPKRPSTPTGASANPATRDVETLDDRTPIGYPFP